MKTENYTPTKWQGSETTLVTDALHSLQNYTPTKWQGSETFFEFRLEISVVWNYTPTKWQGCFNFWFNDICLLFE